MLPSVTNRSSRPPSLPSAGDEVFHFRLERELGRGTFARVFLAQQADLGSRRVVVKCTLSEGNEPQTLAQLQHTNIVPIYSAHEDPETGLAAVCMPYFGGASLSQVLGTLRQAPAWPVRGEELVAALAAAQRHATENSRNPVRKRSGELPVTGAGKEGTGPTPLHLLAGLSYCRAAAWIVARLADGLQHAHQRGVFHHDIKPSNILLGADGQPMLLDFNLARRVYDEQAQAAAVLGGTATYMAPEHLRALTSKDRELHQKVDHRSDIYSLGMVLFELLTGECPFTLKGSSSALPVLIELMAMERMRSLPSARQQRPDIPWSLESILRKALLPDPAQRYQQPAHLAVDLRRFLEDQPLRYAPELSRVEGACKWLRRHPRLTSSASVAAAAAVLLIGAAAALVGIRQNLAAAEKRLEVSQSQERKRAFQTRARQALCMLNTATDPSDHLASGMKACRDALALYEVLDRDDWQEQPAWLALSPLERNQLGEDVRELLLLLAWVEGRRGSVSPSSLDRALKLLDRAEEVQGLPESLALWENRAACREKKGEAAEAAAARAHAQQLPPAGVRDRFLLAAALAHKGRHAEAVAQLDQAVEQNGRHYWSFFLRGVCRRELGKVHQAVGDFGVCIGLWPEFALAYFQRGCCLDQSGDRSAAVSDYTAALERDPALLPAYAARGMARLELTHFAEALADFRTLIAQGRDDAFVHSGQGMALEGLGQFAEADASFQTAFRQARSSSETVQARINLVYGWSVLKRRPDRAMAAFDAVLAQHPRNAQALHGRAMLLAEKGQIREAIAHLDRAVDSSPNLLEARRCRAVLQARRGKLEPARAEISACLLKVPDSGSVLYSAACVAAWQARQSADASTAQQARAQALALLEKAFARGYGQDKAARDPDLAGVWSDPRFKRLLQTTKAAPSRSAGAAERTAAHPLNDTLHGAP